MIDELKAKPAHGEENMWMKYYIEDGTIPAQVSHCLHSFSSAPALSSSEYLSQ